jgi:hypothetical protein
MLPFILCSELNVRWIVVVTTESGRGLFVLVSCKIALGPLRTGYISIRAIPILIKLAVRVVLGAQVPVNVNLK